MKLLALACVLACVASSTALAKPEQWTMTFSVHQDDTMDQDKTDKDGFDRVHDISHLDATGTAVFEVDTVAPGTWKGVKLVKLTGAGVATYKHTRRMRSTTEGGGNTKVTETIEEDHSGDGTLDTSLTTNTDCTFVVNQYIAVACTLHYPTLHKNHAREQVNGVGEPTDSTSNFDNPFSFSIQMEPATPDMIKSKHWSATHVENLTDPRMLAMGMKSTATATVDIRAGAREPVELVVEADGYDSWIPEGNLSDSISPGNHMAVKATLKTKSGKPVPADMLANRIAFKLQNGSKLPGIATNFPANAKDSDYDLRIRKDDNLAAFKVDADELGGEKRGPTDVAVVDVSSFDFGGWADILVTADLADGTTVTGHLKGKPEGPIALPKRTGSSKIAEVWRKTRSAGKADNADDDPKPVGNKFAGDGFTTFEEYRGVVCDGKHLRMDPTTKDLLIRFSPSLRDPGAVGVGYLIAGTKLAVHTCTSELEIPADRVVTSNHGDAPHLVDQHGIYLEGGEENGGSASSEKAGTPASAGHIRLSDPPSGKNRERTEWDATIAHEIGHAIGLDHHGDGDIDGVYWIKRADGTLAEEGAYGHETEITLLDDAGKAVPVSDPYVQALWPDDAKPKSMRLYVTVAGGQESGDTSCFMRQSFSMNINHQYITIIADRSNPTVRRWIRAAEPVGTRLCSSKKGTNINAPGHRPMRWHDDATRGDCVHAFVVNDAYKP